MINKLSRNWLLRILTLPICGGLVVEIAIDIAIRRGVDAIDRLGGFFLIGFFLSAIVGWPLLALLERFFSKYRFRYIIGGIACSIGIWILLDGPIFPKDWHRWVEPDFWLLYAPRRVATFSCFGLITGAVYTAAVALINRWVPAPSSKELNN